MHRAFQVAIAAFLVAGTYGQEPSPLKRFSLPPPGLNSTRQSPVTRIPLGDGGVLFISEVEITTRVGQQNTHYPQLSFRLTTPGTSRWETLDIEFDIGDFCKGQPKAFRDLVTVHRGNGIIGDLYSDTPREIADVFSTAGCETEMITARIRRPSDPEQPRLALEDIASHRTRREANEKAIALRDAEIRAVTLEQEAERQAAKDKSDAIEAARVRRACADLFKRTGNLKMAELTVGEEEAVRACEALGLYGRQ